jgi:hypothetical protein
MYKIAQHWGLIWQHNCTTSVWLSDLKTSYNRQIYITYMVRTQPYILPIWSEHNHIYYLYGQNTTIYITYMVRTQPYILPIWSEHNHIYYLYGQNTTIYFHNRIIHWIYNYMFRPCTQAIVRLYCNLTSNYTSWPLVPKFAGSHLVEAIRFLGWKNHQCAFLQRGSKAIGPMS